MHPRLCVCAAAVAAISMLGTSARAQPDRDRPEPAEDRSEPRPHYVRAAVEMAMALGAGTAWYWIDRERQVADWDFPSWEQRLTFEAWRYDNNPFGINYVWHGFDGAGYHVLARSNDLSLLASLGYGFATSMAWEFLFEFREKVSVNDVIVTPGAGLAIGEFFHWLGRHAYHQHPVARWTAAFPLAVHDSLDGALERPELDIWHELDIGYAIGVGDASVGTETTGDTPTLNTVRFNGRLVALLGHLRDAAHDRWFFDANVTALSFEATATGDGTGVDFLADTMIFGRHVQRVDADGTGWALYAGPSIAYAYRREQLGAWSDRLAALHLPGPAIDVDIVGHGWRLSAGARAHLDFAGVDAHAHDDWMARHPDAVGKTILRKQGYYYAWGGSARARASLSVGRLALGASAWVARYDSDEGLDRNQEDLTMDVDLDDTSLDAEAWLRARPYRSYYLELRWSHQDRRSEQDGLSAEQRLDRLLLGAGLVF